MAGGGGGSQAPALAVAVSKTTCGVIRPDETGNGCAGSSAVETGWGGCDSMLSRDAMAIGADSSASATTTRDSAAAHVMSSGGALGNGAAYDAANGGMADELDPACGVASIGTRCGSVEELEAADGAEACAFGCRAARAGGGGTDAPGSLPPCSTCLALRKPHALQSVIPQRHLGVSVTPQAMHMSTLPSAFKARLRFFVPAGGALMAMGGSATAVLSATAALSAWRPLAKVIGSADSGPGTAPGIVSPPTSTASCVQVGGAAVAASVGGGGAANCDKYSVCRGP
mmetsp:Transcript_72890/g.144874  ORF Transcript_72890/g.144874 Transcript_72890/m.144874 type:complete len:285 (+) Transcript_72890:481-1335(+)